MKNKSFIQGFPFTEEDIHGVHQDIPKHHLQGAVHAMVWLNEIFNQHKTIKVKKDEGDEK